MSKQPQILIHTTAGIWSLAAHRYLGEGCIQYSANLHPHGNSTEIACYVFASEKVEVDDGCLILDNTHIALGGQVYLVDQFLIETHSYVTGATA